MPVLSQMNISTFSNVTPKIVIQQTCWFVLKTFYKCTCDCAGIKKIDNQECVEYCFNAPKLLLCSNWCLL
ncbi:hypothetical protein AB205_0080050 [Aquarana catesbeiana]|uniref:Uncharacterized protein n=1 Tax=Aquarana catesbeiana TaxID=8400 RepID=A0A2G9Q874_AQUCT|nr:hypothetical protein AB205_0080050 [Aquarana catesbeiana]